MEFEQQAHQAIDIAEWHRDEEYEIYPEGARDKILVYSPLEVPYRFLDPTHRYLFKRSSSRYPDQYWVEVFAYLLGRAMEIDVTPTFVSYDSHSKHCGALIGWFLTKEEQITHGGDYFQMCLPEFDRKKGTQHNFETVSQIFTGSFPLAASPFSDIEWQNYWAKAFLFDALIGNTDRHQDNWGIIINNQSRQLRITPVFDNGTSMGHEIFPKNFSKFESLEYMKNYILKGCHHMKWLLSDKYRIEHCAMLKEFIKNYPKVHQIMLNCLNRVNNETFKKILNHMTQFNVPEKLTPNRANFMLKLLNFRHQRLLSELGG